MTDSTNPIIKQARQAAKRAYAEPEAVYSSSADAALAGADAAMRVLLTELREQRYEVIVGAQRREVVPLADIDALLKELGDV